MEIQAKPRIIPSLDPGFLPGSVWNREYSRVVETSGDSQPLAIALHRPSGSVSVYKTRIFPHSGDYIALNERYTERLLKFLLWQRGGNKITIAGEPAIAEHLRSVYSREGARKFDYDFMGDRVYGSPMTFHSVPYDEAPEPNESGSALGRHLVGCRIGFDLGGSDRKASAVIDGEVVFTEEITWDPYFQADPDYHFQGIQDSLKRAAAKLPRVDAIGGSAAGVYVDNEVRVASLFRGVPRDVFDSRVQRMFFELQKEWGGIPFIVVNDGEVTALAASMSLGVNAVLGISMGTSTAGGYVTPQGTITDWLNELAFAPFDYRMDAPKDEWSGDGGAGAQYFSQQAVARLLPAAGIEVSEDIPLAERLNAVQKLLAEGDERARKIFETIGVYLGYGVAQCAEFYEIQHVLVLGRVTSGEAGDIILANARKVLGVDFPEIAKDLSLHLPDEKSKRHGQAVAAASLPALKE
jgi:predicted NBD/HSP70 family sugar kinase